MRIDVDLHALQRGEAQALRFTPGGEARVARTATHTLVLQGQPRIAGGDDLDAEALLARHLQLGRQLTADLHGAYAFAVVDHPAAEVQLLNDRMAQRGWCYALTDGRLRAAPRADTIADGAELDAQALFTYLSNHVIPAPDTVFRGVRRLPAAHRLRVTPNGHTLTRHWEPVFQAPREADFPALRERFRTLVQGAVQREWRRHGPETGTFLSGGTDSSTVSGMLQAVAGAKVHAYSIGFDANGYDEMEYARIAARQFGLQHHEHYLSPAEVASAMPLVAEHYDQPFGNSSAVAAYHCARVAREDGRSTLLAGDGGDEVFGGNARYAKQSLFGWYERVPSPLRAALLQPLLDNGLASRLPGVSKASSYVQQARVPMPDRLHMYNLLRRLGLAEVLTPGFLAQVDPDHDLAQQREVYGRSQGAHLVNRMLAYDWRYTLADNDLPKVMGTTGLAHVATAFPLLADEIVDFSLQLPVDYKLKGLKLRWFFKEALRGFLPDEILIKKKQGFGLPFGVWALRDQGLAKLADDALASFGTRGVVSPTFMQCLRQELLPAHPGYYGELVWIIAMLELWLRERRPDFRFM